MQMRLLLLSLCLTLCSACATETPGPVKPEPAAVTPDPVCPGTRAARAELAATLGAIPDVVITTPWGERVVKAGALLIDLVDARCAA